MLRVCRCDRPSVRCVASAAVCVQPFLAAMSSVRVAMLAASWVCPGLALFLKWLGRVPLKNYEFKSSGFSGFATDCENLLFPLKGRAFESTGFTGASTVFESFLFPLKGCAFESSGFTGAATEFESPLFPLKGRGFEFPGLPGFVSDLESFWFQGFVSPLKEQVLAFAGLLVTSRIANVFDCVKVISGSHAAAAISGGLYACSRIAVQGSGRVGRPISWQLVFLCLMLHPNEGYFAKYPSPGIQLQCFRQILYWFHDGAL